MRPYTILHYSTLFLFTIAARAEANKHRLQNITKKFRPSAAVQYRVYHVGPWISNLLYHYEGPIELPPRDGSVVLRVKRKTLTETGGILETTVYYREGCCGYPIVDWGFCEENCEKELLLC